MTDDQLLDLTEDYSEKVDLSSDNPTHTVVLENLSDFNPDLPTRVAGKDQTPLAKVGVVEIDKSESDEGKSEKTVPG